ncbi:uncharacterized protein EI90DRAFT_3029088 [Cantharellus anzutake]|uniref:uncharacterized protein n=1 Tax=Cantharellus anzutake TaxID=1750568 RepID=UPI001905B369|nr:uncharacterized protein EI90DRAFT_3029088 [Cantharellus anzutake]KAF8344289.1 hypothetical protein EI90DRAFT_3029088 [Cantharellus anzutake]
MSAVKGAMRITKAAKKGAVYVCQTCAAQGIDNRYSRIEYLHRHQRTHSENKPFVCEHCGKRYARSDVLFRHRKKCAETPKEQDSNKRSQLTEPPPHTLPRSRGVRPYPDPYLTSLDASTSRLTKNLPSLFSTSPLAFDGQDPAAVPSDYGESELDRLFSEAPDFSSLPDFIGSVNGPHVLSISEYDGGNILNPTSFDTGQSYSEPPLFSQTIQDKSEWPVRPMNTLESNPFSTEPTLMLAENNLFRELRGQCGVDSSNPFFFDATRVIYCYMIPRWKMPNATKMSALAYRTFNTVMEHLSVVHMPTFRLEDAHNWLIFAMCTAAPRPASDLRETDPTNYGDSPVLRKALDEIDSTPDWPQSQDLIRRDKTDILVKSFYQTARGRKLTAMESLPLIHALLLYNSSSFLSENQTDRLAGELYLATITSVARQSGLFTPGSVCTNPEQLPKEEWPSHWKLWITHESWRRTAWLVYTLDTLAHLESNAIAHIPPRDLRHIPLPYPDSAWNAPTADGWASAMSAFGWTSRTVDDGMYAISASDGSPEQWNIFRKKIGPYARHILILTILRGIVAYGRGEPGGGYVTKRWVLAGRNGDRVAPTENISRHNYIISAYWRMLNFWRQAWDFDITCQLNHRGVHFINDALPPYWLCRTILSHIASPPPPYVPSLRHEEDPIMTAPYPLDDEEDGPNLLANTDLKDMFNVARRFVSNREGTVMSSPSGSPYASSTPSPSGVTEASSVPSPEVQLSGSRSPGLSPKVPPAPLNSLPYLPHPFTAYAF